MAAFRLRYEVFTEEQGDARYADHEQRMCCDALDNEQSQLLLAVTAEGIVGTSRLSFRSAGPFLSDESYRWDLFALELRETVHNLISSVALWDRGAVLPAFRRSGILSSMEQNVTSEARENGCCAVVAVVHSYNAETIAFLEIAQVVLVLLDPVRRYHVEPTL